MPRSTRRWSAVAGLATLLAVAAPLAQAQAQGTARPAAQAAATPAATDFSGIVALSDCSGAIVRWTSSAATDPALMLTNGHCYKFFGPREVIVNLPSVRSVTLLKADGSTAGTVQTTTLLYGTMWQTDVSLYQLSLTYRQLKRQYGVPAITISDHHAVDKHQPISIISGYWKTEYDCDLNAFAYRLHENGWTWRKSLRYEDGGCQIIGGTSGSPVLDANRMEIGINNTIDEADGDPCSLDNPCEQNHKGQIHSYPNRGYGQEVWLFYTCLNDNKIDLDKVGCKLPQP